MTRNIIWFTGSLLFGVSLLPQLLNRLMGTAPSLELFYSSLLKMEPGIWLIATTPVIIIFSLRMWFQLYRSNYELN